MSHKNDYSCIVYFGKNEKPKKWTYVHNLRGFASFLDKEHSTWTYFNVYSRRTAQYLKRFYKGNIIPLFLSSMLLALVCTFFLTFNKLPLNHSSAITFNNGIYNTATIWTLHKQKGGCL